MTIKLGENKEVELTPWKAKTKKDFIKVFRDKGNNVAEGDIINTLVKPYISDPKRYYSSDEIQYMLVELRRISTDENIEFTMDCDNPDCGKPINVKTTLTDITNYKPSLYPTENEIQWRDIDTPKVIDELTKKYPEEPPREIAMLLHIENYKGTPVTQYNDILNIVDNMSLKDKNDLDELYEKVKATIDIKEDIKCPNCGVTTTYNFDIIPTFFDPLLPKEL